MAGGPISDAVKLLDRWSTFETEATWDTDTARAEFASLSMMTVIAEESMIIRSSFQFGKVAFQPANSR